MNHDEEHAQYTLLVFLWLCLSIIIFFHLRAVILLRSFVAC